MKKHIILSFLVLFVAYESVSALTMDQAAHDPSSQYSTLNIVAKKIKYNKLDNASNNKITNEEGNSAAAKGVGAKGLSSAGIDKIPDSNLEGQEESTELLAKKIKTTSIEEASNNRSLGKSDGYSGGIKGATDSGISADDTEKEKVPDSFLNNTGSPANQCKPDDCDSCCADNDGSL